jgi:hypothetical protein
MSKTRTYSQNTLAIMERFFNAVEICRRLKLIPSITEFCESNGIDKPHFYLQRKYPHRGFFEVGWLVPLTQCGVSASWLLTGRGQMFEKIVIK